MTAQKLIREYSEITIRFEIDDHNSQGCLSDAKNAIDQRFQYGGGVRYTLTRAELKREYGPVEEEG